MIPFTKAHACGNDFLIVEASHVPEASQAETAKQLCARNTGVGGDGVEYFEWLGEFEGRIHLRNADGSAAEISGNGTRCVAAWMAAQKNAGVGTVLRIETDVGWRECRIVEAKSRGYEIVSGMGVPQIEESSVKLSDGRFVAGARVSTGNPHFVIFVGDSDYRLYGRTWQSIGEEICSHPDFSDQTNVEFVKITNQDEIEIRIFERGVGPTSSSGTGTCASATAAIALRQCSSRLRVESPGGAQHAEWGGKDAEIFLTGPAVLIASGNALIDIRGSEP